MINILLAEDDEIMRITVRDRLMKNNWHVDAVRNGKEALKRLQKGRYQVVISDIRMPELDGWELVGFIQRTFPDTDILLMTSYGSVDAAAPQLFDDAADYILKPFDMEEMVAKVSRILQRQCNKAV